MSVELQPILAISLSDAYHYGCPHCGVKGGNTTAQGNYTRVFKCDNRCREFYIVNDGLTKSGIGLSGIFADVMPHPLKPSRE